MRPPRVAGEDIAERAVVDHIGPGTVLLDDLPGAVEVAALSLDLLEAAWLSVNDRLRAWLACILLDTVGDAVAEFACPLADVGGGLADHASNLACWLNGVEAGDSLPMLPACGGADFQVGGEIVAALVLWKVWLAGRVPCGEAAVANTLGEEDLLAMVVIWLVGKDVLKGLGLGLSLGGLGCLWRFW